MSYTDRIADNLYEYQTVRVNKHEESIPKSFDKSKYITLKRLKKMSGYYCVFQFNFQDFSVYFYRFLFMTNYALLSISELFQH